MLQLSKEHTTLPAGDIDDFNSDLSTSCGVESPGYSELSSIQNDDTEMEISLESTSDGLEQPDTSSTLLGVSDKPMNSSDLGNHSRSLTTPPPASNIDHDKYIRHSLACELLWYGFKICGDNIDKNVHRRHEC